MEEDELTEQCGVNTSNSFNTPPKEAPPAPGKTQTPDPKFTPKSTSDPTAELSPAEFADLADQLEEEEPREATPVEKLIDTVKMVFERYPHLRNRLPIAMLTYAEEAQEFLDDNTYLPPRKRQEEANKALAKRVEELEKHIEGLEEIAKRYRPDLDVLDEFPKLHFKNVHVIRLLLWELGVGRENKTD